VVTPPQGSGCSGRTYVEDAEVDAEMADADLMPPAVDAESVCP